MSRPEARLAAADDLPACLRVRREVFVEEQRVPEDLEVDGLDDACAHFLATLDAVPVGAARLRVAEEGAKAERVAVLRPLRGRGVGVALMAALEAEAARRGHGEVHLHAQQDAVGFYLRLGYEAHGEPFHEAGIPHLAMSKRLARG